MKILSNRRFRYMRMSLEIANELAELNEATMKENKLLRDSNERSKKILEMNELLISQNKKDCEICKSKYTDGCILCAKDRDRARIDELRIQREICAQAYDEAVRAECIDLISSDFVFDAILNAYTPRELDRMNDGVREHSKGAEGIETPARSNTTK